MQKNCAKIRIVGNVGGERSFAATGYAIFHINLFHNSGLSLFRALKLTDDIRLPFWRYPFTVLVSSLGEKREGRVSP